MLMTNLSRFALAASLAIAVVSIGRITEVRADANAPVCAQGYGKFDGLSCNFANYDQCRATVSGIAATCVDNPYLRAAQNQMVRPRDGRR